MGGSVHAAGTLGAGRVSERQVDACTFHAFFACSNLSILARGTFLYHSLQTRGTPEVDIFFLKGGDIFFVVLSVGGRSYVQQGRDEMALHGYLHGERTM